MMKNIKKLRTPCVLLSMIMILTFATGMAQILAAAPAAGEESTAVEARGAGAEPTAIEEPGAGAEAEPTAIEDPGAAAEPTANEEPGAAEEPGASVEQDGTGAEAPDSKTPDSIAAPINSRMPARGTEYTIDVNDYYGSVSASGRGYSYNETTGILTFNADAAGNSYTIIRSQAGLGAVSGIAFARGGSPESVTINGINLSKGISLPDDFSANLTFNKTDVHVNLGAALALPAGYGGILGINGLTVPELTFPPDYSLPIIYNGLISAAVNYPAGYNEPITIAGGVFSVPGSQQFPAGYDGPVTIGGGSPFAGTHVICRPGADLNSAENGIFLPDNIRTLTMDSAATVGSAMLIIRLGAVDVADSNNPDGFRLLLAGDSVIRGNIEVADCNTLTIDSAAGTGSESGRLAITSDSANACIGGAATGESGLIVINGGTVEATQTGTGFSLPAAIGGGADRAGYVVINGGSVTAVANAEGAAIGGGSGTRGVGYVTITGGTVNALGGENGAAIGGGYNSNGGFVTADNPYPIGAEILITGGAVTATAGDINGIMWGNAGGYGAGIGGGRNGNANITITGGHVTANSGNGAGIGNGVSCDCANAGSITITGGTIRGYTAYGANIGASERGSCLPAYAISKEADILMYGRTPNNANPGSIICGGDNQGDGYFVSAFSFKQRIRGDIYVFETNSAALVRVLPIPFNTVVYMSFLFSTGHDYPELFNIYTDYYNDSDVYEGMRQYVHHYDHLPPLPGGGPSTHQFNDPNIPSVTNMNSYPHNFEGTLANALIVCFGENHDTGGGAVFYKITEKYVDLDGKPLPGDAGKDVVISVKQGDSYSKTIPSRTDFVVKGYKIGDPAPSGNGTFTAGNVNTLVTIDPVTADATIYFIYSARKTNPVPTGIADDLWGPEALIVIFASLVLSGWGAIALIVGADRPRSPDQRT